MIEHALRHSGMRPLRRRPGIHNHGPGLWISGSRLKKARPGMTASFIYIKFCDSLSNTSKPRSSCSRHVRDPRTHCAARIKKLGCLKLWIVGWAKWPDANASGGVPTIRSRASGQIGGHGAKTRLCPPNEARHSALAPKRAHPGMTGSTIQRLVAAEDAVLVE